MKKHIILKENFTDARGSIMDILYKTKIDHIALITSQKNSVRGNHYHKKTVQYTYILKGNVQYFEKNIKSKKIKKINLKKNSIVKTQPNQIHAFKFLSNSSMIVFSHGVRGGTDYEKDTFRIVIL